MLLVFATLFSCTEQGTIDLFSSGGSPCKNGQIDNLDFESASHEIHYKDAIITARHKARCESKDLVLYSNETELLDLSKILDSDQSLDDAIIFNDEVWMTFNGNDETSKIKIFSSGEMHLKKEIFFENRIIKTYKIDENQIAIHLSPKTLKIYNVSERSFIDEIKGIWLVSGFLATENSLILESDLETGVKQVEVWNRSTFELQRRIPITTYNPNHNPIHSDSEYVYFITDVPNEYHKRALKKIPIQNLIGGNVEELVLSGMDDQSLTNPFILQGNLMFTIIKDKFYSGSVSDGVMSVLNTFPYKHIYDMEITSDEKSILILAGSQYSNPDVRLLKLDLFGEIIFDIQTGSHSIEIITL